jgi:hypothetical protein
VGQGSHGRRPKQEPGKAEEGGDRERHRGGLSYAAKWEATTSEIRAGFPYNCSRSQVSRRESAM